MMIIMMIMLVHARSMSDDGYDVDDDDDDDGWMDTAIEDTALYRYECMQLIKKPGGGTSHPKTGKETSSSAAQNCNSTPSTTALQRTRNQI